MYPTNRVHFNAYLRKKKTRQDKKGTLPIPDTCSIALQMEEEFRHIRTVPTVSKK